jgi:hypothetical protein
MLAKSPEQRRENGWERTGWRQLNGYSIFFTRIGQGFILPGTKNVSMVIHLGESHRRIWRNGAWSAMVALREGEGAGRAIRAAPGRGPPPRTKVHHSHSCPLKAPIGNGKGPPERYFQSRGHSAAEPQPNTSSQRMNVEQRTSNVQHRMKNEEINREANHYREILKQLIQLRRIPDKI